jgi:hypothetical protein
MAMVRRRIDDADLCFAVWQDDTKPYGVGFLLVKGQHLMRQMLSDNKPLPVRTTAIKCIEEAQAIALHQVAGEQDHRH